MFSLVFWILMVVSVENRNQKRTNRLLNLEFTIAMSPASWAEMSRDRRTGTALSKCRASMAASAGPPFPRPPQRWRQPTPDWRHRSPPPAGGARLPRPRAGQHVPRAPNVGNWVSSTNVFILGESAAAAAAAAAASRSSVPDGPAVLLFFPFNGVATDAASRPDLRHRTV